MKAMTVTTNSLGQRASTLDESRRAQIERWVHLVRLLVSRDLRVRYRGSVLGYLWSMMNPLLYMSILSFVFSHLMKFNLHNFPMFILSGILAWNLFAQSVGIGVNSIVANGSLLKKVRVPATIFPAASVGSCVVNFALALIPFTIIGLITGLQFTPWILTLPIILLPFVLFAFGAALFVSSLNVNFRDVGHTLEPILQIVFYATPIIYPLQSLPERYRGLAQLNPLAHFVTQLRRIMYDGLPPEPAKVALLYALAALALVIGGVVYKRLRNGFVYNV